MYAKLYNSNFLLGNILYSNCKITIIDVIEDLLLIVQQIVNGIATISSSALHDNCFEFKICLSKDHPTVILQYNCTPTTSVKQNDQPLLINEKIHEIIDAFHNDDADLKKADPSCTDRDFCEGNVKSKKRNTYSKLISHLSKSRDVSLSAKLKTEDHNKSSVQERTKVKQRDWKITSLKSITNKNCGGICIRKEIPELLPDLYNNITRSKEEHNTNASDKRLGSGNKFPVNPKNSMFNERSEIYCNKNNSNNRIKGATRKTREISFLSLDNDSTFQQEANSTCHDTFRYVTKNNICKIPSEKHAISTELNETLDYHTLRKRKNESTEMSYGETKAVSVVEVTESDGKNKDVIYKPVVSEMCVAKNKDSYKPNDYRRCFENTDVKWKYKSIHVKERLFACNYCGVSFTRNSSRKRHEKIHTGEKPHTCNYCSKVFIELSAKKNHERIHTGEKIYSCSYCQKLFASLNSKKEHERTHTEDKLYACNFCDKTFRQLCNKRKHEKIHAR